MKSEGWSWKDPERELNANLRLKYEPGGWGDILKGEWVAALTEATLQDPYVYLDPFCGGRSYALTQAVEQRIANCPADLYRERQAPWLQKGQLGSTASLVEQICARAGVCWQPHFGEADPVRRATWSGEPVELESLLSSVERADLLLWDPYDFHYHWPRWLPILLERSRREVVAIYLFNRSPQGSSQLRNYRSMLERIGAHPYWLGRVAADLVLPRAYHEMLVLGTEHLNPDCGKRLQNVTRELARWQATRGCWQEF
jgi:hypothetical protein